VGGRADLGRRADRYGLALLRYNILIVVVICLREHNWEIRVRPVFDTMLLKLKPCRRLLNDYCVHL
jgi:hypothetical protein